MSLKKINEIDKKRETERQGIDFIISISGVISAIRMRWMWMEVELRPCPAL
jgi:hypothetical protein